VVKEARDVEKKTYEDSWTLVPRDGGCCGNSAPHPCRLLYF
jgi:hypothetical protein